MTNTEPLLKLTTQIKPAEQVEIDGELYDLKGFEHLSPDEEAAATADFARFERLLRELARAGDERAGIRLARKMRDKRIDILTKLTTIPRDVAEQLPPSAQTELFKLVRTTSGTGAPEDEDEPDVGDFPVE